MSGVETERELREIASACEQLVNAFERMASTLASIDQTLILMEERKARKEKAKLEIAMVKHAAAIVPADNGR